jgi:hypothetical protein
MSWFAQVEAVFSQMKTDLARLMSEVDTTFSQFAPPPNPSLMSRRAKGDVAALGSEVVKIGKTANEAKREFLKLNVVIMSASPPFACLAAHSDRPSPAPS